MKKKRKRHVVLAIISLLVLCAVLLWYLRKDLRKLARSEGKKPAAQEKITDEDRRRLEEILKRR